MRSYSVFSAALLLTLLSGCVKYAESTTRDTLNENYQIIYPKIENASIELAAFKEEVEVVSGSPAVLELTLLNSGTQVIDIPEWYQDEANNFLVHFRPFDPDESPEEALAAEWFMIAPEFVKGKAPDRRHLSIAPGNKAICSVPLEFVELLPPDTNMLFIAFAELNLKSITATSPMFIIVSHNSTTENEQ